MNKKLFSVAALSLLLAFGFSGCKDDDNEPQKNIVKLGAQSNATIGAFYSVSEKKVYTQALAFENQAKIDLLCFYEVTDTQTNYTTLSSPGANITGIFTGETSVNNFTTKNLTKFTLPATAITVEQFDLIVDGDASIATYFNATITSGNKKAKQLAVGNIYAFLTQDGTYGLFKVISLSNPESETGWIEFELKLYKPTV